MVKILKIVPPPFKGLSVFFVITQVQNLRRSKHRIREYGTFFFTELLQKKQCYSVQCASLHVLKKPSC